MDKLSNWLESGDYLPIFMREFHDQKDVFKAMHNTSLTLTRTEIRVMVISTWLILSFGIWRVAATRCRNHEKTFHSKIWMTT